MRRTANRVPGYWGRNLNSGGASTPSKRAHEMPLRYPMSDGSHRLAKNFRAEISILPHFSLLTVEVAMFIGFCLRAAVRKGILLHSGPLTVLNASFIRFAIGIHRTKSWRFLCIGLYRVGSPSSVAGTEAASDLSGFFSKAIISSYVTSDWQGYRKYGLGRRLHIKVA